MEELNLKEVLDNTSENDVENTQSNTDNLKNTTNSNNSNSTEITEYKEVDEPCVSLTIIGENRLTDTEIFIRRGIKYSIKAFFSAIILTIMNMFI